MDVRTAQAVKFKLSNVQKEKQLKVHLDKTGYIAVCSKEYQDSAKNEVQYSPIIFGNIVTKMKTMKST